MNQNAEEFKNFLKKLGQNIKKVRCANGLSQEQLAFSIDSARNYIGCIERAEKNLSLKTLFRLAKALNVNVEELIKDTMY